ncbi:hydrogenase expression/formation protein HypD [Cyanobium sp. NS01]|nr:hydrogenase formation protein HypD [Cyanobium sp. NS01]QNI71539.1 hydrogenase expression/formation protein HypD [Cyanobium sp. NS01]
MSSTTAVTALAARLRATVTRPWTLMEVCGGQTHAIVRWGLDQLLPDGLRLIHGPGCPVCVTPAASINQALALARRPEVILCAYGDMLRVPGSEPGDDLLRVRAAGGDVRLLTSPLQAIALAQSHPAHQVVFLAVGFETTAPATALLAQQTARLGLANLSLLMAHVRVVPAMAAILAAPGNQVQGFLAAGHVSTVMGLEELHPLVERHQVPVVVSGFEPEELLRGVLGCVELLEAGRPAVLNAYPQVVREQGNPGARALLQQVFQVVDQPWRGLGVIAAGGLALRPELAWLDARGRFDLAEQGRAEGAGAQECIAAQVLQGRALPSDCAAFGSRCRPEHPLGAPMVSSEGACAAYHRYRAVPCRS